MTSQILHLKEMITWKLTWAAQISQCALKGSVRQKDQKKVRRRQWRFIHGERTGSKGMAGKPYLQNYFFQTLV